MDVPDLATARLTLSAPGRADAPDIVRLVNDLAVSRWLGRVPFPYAPADADYYLSEVVPAEYVWKAAHASTGEMAGLVSLMPRRKDDGLVLGYWLGRAHWGQGFATEAARRVVDHAFADLGRDRVDAGCVAENVASARVLRKLGFVEFGRSTRRSAALDLAMPHIDMRLDRSGWRPAEGR